MLRPRTTLAAVAVGVLCDTLASEVGVTWLTVPQRDARRSRSSAASVSLEWRRPVCRLQLMRPVERRRCRFAGGYLPPRSIDHDGHAGKRGGGGASPNSDCSYPSISADGRYLAFATVVAGDPDRALTDVVLRDRVADSSRRITIAPGGALSNGWSSQPVVSANASVVVFTSAATNLLSEPDVNGPQPDIYRFDVGGGAIERISVDGRGVQHQGGSQMASVSGDGRYVVFSSTAILSGPRTGSERTLNQGQYPWIYLRDTRPGKRHSWVVHRSLTVAARWRRSAPTGAPSPSLPAPRISLPAIETRSRRLSL